MVVSMLALGIAACAGSAADGQSAPPAAPNDSFNGHIVAGTSRYAGKHAPVTVRIYRAGSRKATFVFTGKSCRGSRHCLDLEGTLHGTLTRVPSNPDVGKGYAVRAHGRLDPLGKTKATGTVGGPGNIRYGHEEIQLVLKASHGTVTVRAFSRLVPGFSSP